VPDVLKLLLGAPKLATHRLRGVGGSGEEEQERGHKSDKQDADRHHDAAADIYEHFWFLS